MNEGGLGRLSALVLACACASACHGEAREAHRAEAARVVYAVEQLRSAPNAGKEPLLRALEHEPCTSADVCELKSVCLAAYRDELGAMAGVRALGHALAEDAAAPAAASAAALVSDSERRLERAHAGTRRCTDLEGALVRAAKL